MSYISAPRAGDNIFKKEVKFNGWGMAAGRETSRDVDGRDCLSCLASRKSAFAT